MKQETLNKYINTTKGVLTVIDLDHMKNKYDLNTFQIKYIKFIISFIMKVQRLSRKRVHYKLMVMEAGNS